MFSQPIFFPSAAIRIAAEILLFFIEVEFAAGQRVCFASLERKNEKE
jgi:hypothetical protein